MTDQEPERRRMNLWLPITDRVTLAYLGKLQEELGELQSALARVLIQGLTGVEPVTGKVNRDWLQEELADVEAMTQLTIEHLDLDLDNARVHRKMDNKREWAKMIRAWEDGPQTAPPTRAYYVGRKMFATVKPK